MTGWTSKCLLSFDSRPWRGAGRGGCVFFLLRTRGDRWTRREVHYIPVACCRRDERNRENAEWNEMIDTYSFFFPPFFFPFFLFLVSPTSIKSNATEKVKLIARGVIVRSNGGKKRRTSDMNGRAWNIFFTPLCKQGQKLNKHFTMYSILKWVIMILILIII